MNSLDISILWLTYSWPGSRLLNTSDIETGLFETRRHLIDIYKVGDRPT